jgi:hypothetical protein
MIASLALFGSLLLADPEPLPPVAVVLSTKGTITLERGSIKRPLRARDLLRPNDLVMAGDGEAVLAFLGDFHCERVKPDRKATVGPKGCAPDSTVEKVEGVPLNRAQMEGVRGLARSERGAYVEWRGNSPDTSPAVAPIPGSTVLTDKPDFTWPAVEQADGYEVEIRSGDDRRSVWKATAKDNRCAYPKGADFAPLKYGVKYVWRVTARKNGQTMPEPIAVSQFTVLTPEEIESLASLGQLKAAKDKTHWLLAALTYEAFGAYGEALPLYEKLAENAPREVNYQIALAAYYERAGRADKAKLARDKAKQLGADPTEVP